MGRNRYQRFEGKVAILLASFLVIFAHLIPASAWADDRHAGYYYPPPQTTETYPARVPALLGADKRTRVGFITGFTAALLDRPVPVSIILFAKGAEAEKLILISVRDNAYNTVYRQRALLAMLTAQARTNPVFQSHPRPEDVTFLDLLAYIGFEQITISDGVLQAHQITLEPLQ